MTTLHIPGHASLQAFLLDVAGRAGRHILEHYTSGTASVTTKTDESPLTSADLASHDSVMEDLRRATPQIPVVSEELEAAGYEERAGWTRHWLVDPLDGTKEFLRRTGEFTVNVALIDNGRPIAGVVGAPAAGVAYYGEADVGAVRIDASGSRPLRVRPRAQPGPLRVIASRSHATPETTQFLGGLPPHELVSAGSSIKFCRIAEAAADLYPRLGTTMEWDTAAGQAVLEAAGGEVRDIHGSPLRYGKKDLRNPWFVASGDAAWRPLYAGVAERLGAAPRPGA